MTSLTLTDRRRWTPGGRRRPQWPVRRLVARLARSLADERGSLTLGLPVFVAIVVLVGAILFRVGFAADLRAGTQTAADAAALAAAQAVGEEVVALLAEAADAEDADLEDPEAAALPTDPKVLCELVDDGVITAAAEDYAARNGAGVTGYERDCLEVAVSVLSAGGVPGVAGLTGESGPADARAAAVVEIPALAGGGGEAEISEILEAGVELNVRLVE